MLNYKQVTKFIGGSTVFRQQQKTVFFLLMLTLIFCGFISKVTAAPNLLNGGFEYLDIFGTRPLKRTIQQRLENSLATQLLSGKFTDGNTIKIYANAHRFSFEKIK